MKIVPTIFSMNFLVKRGRVIFRAFGIFLEKNSGIRRTRRACVCFPVPAGRPENEKGAGASPGKNGSFSVEHDPFSIENDPFPIENDPFPIENDPFSIENDPFSVENDPFSIEHDPFSVEHDPFSIENGSFSVEHDPFSFQHGSALTARGCPGG
ncbi:MAG: hypothetical protein LBP88_03600 [Treponema sp.]|nr:hypothetical protein [Treponema sp.]